MPGQLPKDLLARGGKLISFGAPVLGAGTPEQHAIGAGDCFLSLVAGFPPIYGHVWTRRDYIDYLRDDGGWRDPRQLETELAWREYRWSLGYRWGSCYSVAEPEGEDGETHVSTCGLITLGEFDAARLRGWQ